MWVQFLLAGPLDNLKERQYNSRMYKVIENKSSTEFANLDLALAFAKELNVFVTIQGGEFEIVGLFGVDSVKDGVCPDGVKYDWNKASRIGRVKRKDKNQLAKEDIIELTGVVEEVLPGSMYKVKIENMPNLMLCYTSGKLKQHKIRIILGDRVKVEVSPYDLSKGRVSYRL